VKTFPKTCYLIVAPRRLHTNYYLIPGLQKLMDNYHLEVLYPLYPERTAQYYGALDHLTYMYMRSQEKTTIVTSEE